MDRRKVIIIIIAVIVILLIAGGAWLGLRAHSRSAESQEARQRLNALKLARTYMEKQEYDRAMEILEELLLENPDDAEAQALLDEIIDRKKLAEMSEREREQQALLEQQEKLKEGLKELGSSIQEKLPQETVVAVQPKEIPDDATAKERERLRKINELMAEGVRRLNSGDHEGARRIFDQVLELDPDSGQAYAYIGKSYLDEDPQRQSNVQAAVEASNKAIQKDRTFYLPHETLAKIYENAKNYEGAVDEYKEAARLKPDDYFL
ncbi:MAG: tetratricopeptide repeat protein, partial [Spirochaetales bacterium]|nr:tetratricopeptide repeat protein [Spirochaetales bacterium]